MNNNADNVTLEILNEDSSVIETGMPVPGGKHPNEKVTPGDGDWLNEFGERLNFFKQFSQTEYLTVASKGYVEMLERIHVTVDEIFWKAKYELQDAEGKCQKAKYESQRTKQLHEDLENELKKVTRQFQEIQQKCEVACKQFDIAKQVLVEAEASCTNCSHGKNTAIDNCQRTLQEHDLVCKQLQGIFETLKWYKSEEKKMRKEIRFTLPYRDDLGQTYLPVDVWEISLFQGVTETIDLKSHRPEIQWEISEKGVGKWQIMDGNKIIILIRRVNQMIQLEWTEEVTFDYDFSEIDESYSLVITHFIDAEQKIARERAYPLFATIPVPTNKSIE